MATLIERCAMAGSKSRLRRRRGVTFGNADPALPQRRRFWRQISNHSVALISLALAATSLGYNTWRNDTTEIQRNLRQASFQVLVDLGELNQVVLYRRYFHAQEQPERGEPQADARLDDARGWVSGWGKVTMIRDLTSFMPEPLPHQGAELFAAWQTYAAQLNAAETERRDQASTAILTQIETLRTAMVQQIDDLR